MHPVETWLSAMHLKHGGATTPETSFYGPIEALLDAVGKTSKPQVKCVMQLAGKQAGVPDGGLYSARSLKRQARAGQQVTLLDVKPEFGVLEVKGIGDDVIAIAKSEQVQKYLDHYGQVIVTNYRDFQLVGRDPIVPAVRKLRERFTVAATPAEFWQIAATPGPFVTTRGALLTEFLQRAICDRVALSQPADIAAHLASYAREALARMEHGDTMQLGAVQMALENALGIQFQDNPKGLHFFRSTLVQTLFYGLFSAWVMWTRLPASKQPGAEFDWETVGAKLRLPVLRTIFGLVAPTPGLDKMKLGDLLRWAADALNRVNREKFFGQFQESHAVQYFYEPFLVAFDPELRKDLGVWYTPPEVVDYMVERVDRALRDELGIADGLADPNVVVLDPCCGTGAYLVSVLDRIARTEKDKGESGSIAGTLRKAATTRLFGFEILPAPFVVAHLQLGLKLRNLDASATGEDEGRIGVYLNNALTGWDPPTGPKAQLLPGFNEERDGAEKVKPEAPIFVVIGNPPYNGFDGVARREEGDPVAVYKAGLVKDWNIKKFNLDDLYVRFFRIAERCIVAGGKGIVCFISNYSYLSDPSFVVMRQRFLAEFDRIDIDCLNGDSRETGKRTPDGKPDPSIFSTKLNPAGIRVGTSVGLFVRKDKREAQATVRFREFWGASKREDLLAAANSVTVDWQPSGPTVNNRLTFRAAFASTAYATWPRVIDLCEESPISGLLEMRRGALTDMVRDELAKRMQRYLDPKVNWEAVHAEGCGPVQDGGRYDARTARQRILARESFDDVRVRRYALYPFDARWAYHTNIRPIWNEPRPDLVANLDGHTPSLVVRLFAERPGEGVPMTMTRLLPDYHLLRPNAVAIPLRIAVEGVTDLFADPNALGWRSNLAPAISTWLGSMGCGDTTAPFVHALAIGYSSAWITENAEAIRQDWPRIPLPARRDTFDASVALGRQVAALLDTEAGVPGVTTSPIRPELRVVGRLSRTDGGDVTDDDRTITASWGRRQAQGPDQMVVMPGSGRIVEREPTDEERDAVRAGLPAFGLAEDEAWQVLGGRMVDVYLNDYTCWHGVPKAAWDFVIGGYQVMKKWLSYREATVLGRGLRAEETAEVRDMARRLTAIVLLRPHLDANYRAVVADTWAWGKA